MPVYVEDEFFALKLAPKKTYTQEVEMPFRVTMAALDPTAEGSGRTSLVVRVDDTEYVLCSLALGKTEQQTLSHVFTPGENVTFFVTGEGTLHLTGNFLSFENEFDEGFGETLGDYDTEDEDAEEDDAEFDSEEFDSDMADFIEEDDSEEEEDEAAEGNPKIEELLEAGAGSSADELDGDDSEDISDAVSLDDEEGSDSEDEDIEIDSDEEIDSDMVDDEDDDEEEDDSEEDSDADSEEEVAPPTRDNKKRASEPAATAQNKKAKQEPETKTAAPAASATRVVQGVKMEEVSAGKDNAPKAKNGRQVGILYTGTLPNGKVFDSNMKGGKPLRFRLGDGSVIKGFDIAVQGLALNGVRKVTIPPHLAYGNKALPGIPKNSTLTFEIKLVELK